MKTININKKAKKQITKEFCLGNGKRIQFGSLREAGYFLAETNRFLTKCMVIINETYCNTFIKYRKFWLITTNHNAGTKTGYWDMEQKIKSLLQAASDCMDKFNSTAWGSNDPFFAFIDLKKAAMFTSEAALLLYSFNKARNLTADYYECQILHERCLLVMQNIDAFDYVK